jgi:dual specificity phosphatase 12
MVAYLMARYKLTVEEAMHRVLQCRNCVSPNQGFMAQLKLFEEMGYKVDVTNVRYKLFAMSTAADRLKKGI